MKLIVVQYPRGHEPVRGRAYTGAPAVRQDRLPPRGARSGSHRPATAERCSCPTGGSIRSPPRGCRPGSRSRTGTGLDPLPGDAQPGVRSLVRSGREPAAGSAVEDRDHRGTVGSDPGVGADVVAVVGQERGQHTDDQVLQGMDPGIEARPGQLAAGRRTPRNQPDLSVPLHRSRPRPPHRGPRSRSSPPWTAPARAGPGECCPRPDRSARPVAGNPSPCCSPARVRTPAGRTRVVAPARRRPGETSASTTGWVR